MCQPRVRKGPLRTHASCSHLMTRRKWSWNAKRPERKHGNLQRNQRRGRRRRLRRRVANRSSLLEVESLHSDQDRKLSQEQVKVLALLLLALALTLLILALALTLLIMALALTLLNMALAIPHLGSSRILRR